MKKIEDYITTIPNFPKEGIMFRDITTVLSDAEGLQLAINELADRVEKYNVDVVCGLESRGFIFGAPIAYKLNKPFVLIRKKGKLPRKTINCEYTLEYGTAAIEIQVDDIKPGQKVVIIDDLIATGGTLKASINLIEKLGAKVEALVALIELVDLKGREVLKGYNIEYLVEYKGE